MMTAESFALDQGMTLERAQSRIDLLVRLGFLRPLRRDLEGDMVYGAGWFWLRAKWRSN